MDAFPWLEERDDLAWRKARGLALSLVEEARLVELDALLDETDGNCDPLPSEVRALIDEVLGRKERAS